MSASRRYSDWALLLLATSATLRFGELAGLRRNQIDLDACKVRVNTSTSEMDDGPLIDGRSGEANRARSRWPRLAPPSEWRPSSSNRTSQPFATRPFA
jgi:site-specific recombinase XerC